MFKWHHYYHNIILQVCNFNAKNLQLTFNYSLSTMNHFYEVLSVCEYNLQQTLMFLLGLREKDICITIKENEQCILVNV